MGIDTNSMQALIVQECGVQPTCLAQPQGAAERKDPSAVRKQGAMSGSALLRHTSWSYSSASIMGSTNQKAV